MVTNYRPGFVRISFNYFIDESTFQYIIKAIKFMADEAWKFLPEYTFYPDTGNPNCVTVNS